MLIGTHVSPAGGPAKAVARGVERGANAIQIFNQNPRAWKPTIYSDEAVEEFRSAMADSDVDALIIHAVYLLNAALGGPGDPREDADVLDRLAAGRRRAGGRVGRPASRARR